MIYDITFSKESAKQLKKIKTSDKKIFEKIFEILQFIQKDPNTSLYHGETLKGFTQLTRSVRYNQKDRIVYQVLDEEIIVYILTLKGHYSDK